MHREAREIRHHEPSIPGGENISIDEQIAALFQEIERELQAHNGQGIALAGVGAEAAIAATERCQGLDESNPFWTRSFQALLRS